MKVYTFPRGGLSFEDATVPSKQNSEGAFLPVFAVIPLTQLSGGRVYQVVSIGDTVKEGMLIGRASDAGSANVHATVPGKVIRKISWKDEDGRSIEALIIRLEGSFERLGKKEEVFPWTGMGSFDLQRVIADYGVTEMEGDGRPVAEMISAFRSAVEPLTLVVRCIFDDPWLAADYALCKERLKAVVEGSFIMARACGKVSKILYAVSHKEKELGEQMLAAAAGGEIPFSMVLVGSRYPQRHKYELEDALRSYGKKEGVKLGSLLILGPATLAAVHDAVKLKKPTLERYVTVGGSALRKPKVLKARIGTRLTELFAECGGFIDAPSRIAVGSPLLGRIVTNLNEPVVKTSCAVFAMLKGQTGQGAEQNCISCGECRSVCPVELDPEELYKQTINSLEVRAAEVCHGCGCCEVVCPSHLPLSRVILEKSQGKTHD
jgi:electron transport complex protein RnfC